MKIQTKEGIRSENSNELKKAVMEVHSLQIAKNKRGKHRNQDPGKISQICSLCPGGKKDIITFLMKTVFMNLKEGHVKVIPYVAAEFIM